jgi:hypothetical protein
MVVSTMWSFLTFLFIVALLPRLTAFVLTYLLGRWLRTLESEDPKSGERLQIRGGQIELHVWRNLGMFLMSFGASFHLISSLCTFHFWPSAFVCREWQRRGGDLTLPILLM